MGVAGREVVSKVSAITFAFISGIERERKRKRGRVCLIQMNESNSEQEMERNYKILSCSLLSCWIDRKSRHCFDSPL